MATRSKTTCHATAPRSKTTRGLLSLASAASLALLMGLAGCSQTSDDPVPVPTNATLTAAQRGHIRLMTVAMTDFNSSFETSGVVDFDNEQATSVIAPFSGSVTRLLVSPGDKVTKGQPLAIVASGDFAAAVSGYRKAVVTAQTLRKLADVDKDLLSHNGVSEREAQQAQTDAVNAEADRDAALQGLNALQIDKQTLEDVQQGHTLSHIEGVIRAPISGTVAEKLITPGQFIQAGTTPAFTVADLSKVWVMAQLSDTELASVHPGDRVEILAGSAKTPLSGKVDNISAEVNPDTRSVIARVVVENPGELLKKQMYVRVQLQSQQKRNGLLIPVSAILRDDENLPFVYLLQQDGSFARRSVTLGARISDQYVIEAGLRSGEQIVIDGALFLQFMQSQ